ncbi:VOC family protein [Cryptosporangium aurantiacum]|uniref:Glyoxalase-like domain-containing protein n=1 Tax=Cryptosporangium aurantiacum TaxID=134849 RepID=A0A1M7QTK4_9ACTN|nr:VOC family protein [Cryptosporangium aurantiacum]SHN35084.1 hypothetical protein SAMN05443668_105348 [Cryptosporangium aurantiacum]
MTFWQLTIDAHDPALLARFWAPALGYQATPPSEPDTTWNAHYHALPATADDRIFDPAGRKPPIWFQRVPESKAGKNRLHLDLYPTERDDTLPIDRRIAIVEATVAELVERGATVAHRMHPDDTDYWVVMHDPEGNEFCVS